MEARTKEQINAAERAEIFHETYDDAVDPGVTLAELVRGAGDYLGRIVSPDVADAAMGRIMEAFGWKAESADWHDVLQENEAYCFSEWPMGQNLHDLTAYAYFGIVLDATEEDSEDQIVELLGTQVAEANAFIALSPLEAWLGQERSPQLETIVMLACNRWALDTHKAVEPTALAIFGGISEGRVRNMMSGAKRTFSNDEGKIPAAEALAWLAGRPEFWNSIWREQRLPRYGVRHRPPLDAPVFVPVARDGSVFHPGLHRGGGFTIGPKGDEIQVDDLEEALHQLQCMPTPYWRRPNEAGTWGLVGGVRWQRLDRSDLQVFVDDPSHRLTPETPG